MHGPTKPPTFDPSDWAQFDFSRWHLDGLPVDAMPAAVADLAQRLFGSEEWRQHFRASLPAVQRGVLDAYREHARQLEQEKTTVAKDFDERIAAAQARTEEFGKAIEAAGSPPIVEPDPQTYQLGVRVTAAKDPQVGLPGVVVQVTAPRDKSALAQGLTDRDGNALLAIPATEASEGTKADATLEILTVEGKSLQRLADAVCIRPNQVDTKVVSLKDSADTVPLKNAALELRSQREARARELVSRIDRLTQERESRLRDLDQRVEEIRTIISDLDQGQEPAPIAPTPGPGPRTDTGSAEHSAPRTRRKRP